LIAESLRKKTKGKIGRGTVQGRRFGGKKKQNQQKKKKKKKKQEKGQQR
jgi:hypothetical protein